MARLFKPIFPARGDMTCRCAIYQVVQCENGCFQRLMLMSLKLRWELIVKSSHMTQICNLLSSAMSVWMLEDSNNAFPTVTMGVHFHVSVPTVSGISA